MKVRSGCGRPVSGGRSLYFERRERRRDVIFSRGREGLGKEKGAYNERFGLKMLWEGTKGGGLGRNFWEREIKIGKGGGKTGALYGLKPEAHPDHCIVGKSGGGNWEEEGTA